MSYKHPLTKKNISSTGIKQFSSPPIMSKAGIYIGTEKTAVSVVMKNSTTNVVITNTTS